MRRKKNYTECSETDPTTHTNQDGETWLNSIKKEGLEFLESLEGLQCFEYVQALECLESMEGEEYFETL